MPPLPNKKKKQIFDGKTNQEGPHHSLPQKQLLYFFVFLLLGERRKTPMSLFVAFVFFFFLYVFFFLFFSRGDGKHKTLPTNDGSNTPGGIMGGKKSWHDVKICEKQKHFCWLWVLFFSSSSGSTLFSFFYFAIFVFLLFLFFFLFFFLFNCFSRSDKKK